MHNNIRWIVSTTQRRFKRITDQFGIDALDDMKAQDITVLNTESLTDEFDRVIIASATSNRQTRGAANNVHEKVKENGGDVLSTEGEDTGEWVLVDCGDIVVHIMQAQIRAYYNLEELWDPSR